METESASYVDRAERIQDAESEHINSVRQQRSRRRRSEGWAAPVFGTAAVVAFGEAVIRVGLIDSAFVPAPSTIGAELLDGLTNAEFWLGVWNTLRTWILSVGLALAVAVPTAIVVGTSARIYRSLRLIIDFLRPIPAIGFLPVLILILGIGPSLKVFAVALAAFWHIFFQTMYGVRDVDPVARDTARAYRLGPLRQFIYVSLAGSTPYIATGTRIAASVALKVTVGVEMVVGLAGIGFDIRSAQYAFNVPKTYALVAASGLIGVVIASGLYQMERRVLRWHPAHRATM